MKFKKEYRLIAILEGFIVCFENFLIFSLLKIFPTPTDFNMNVQRYYEFVLQHYHLQIFENLLGNMIPAFLCIFYAFFWKRNHRAQKLINFPVVLSVAGSVGWMISYLIELAFIFVAKQRIGLVFREVFILTFISFVLTMLFVFTISFFTLKTLNRYIFLPKLFPRGHVQNLEKVACLSIKKINRIYYASVSVLPSIYLLSIIYAMYASNSDARIMKVLILFAVIFVFCFFIHIVFTDYFSTPVRILMEGVERIKNGDLKSRIRFVSNDDFGSLTDAFNDMTFAIKRTSEKNYAFQDSIIKSMAIMIESRDNSTGGHIYRTSDCVQIFVTHLIRKNVYPEVSEQFYRKIVKAAPMHDLGKIAVDDEILRKEGKFTDEERRKMQVHPAEGARIVKFVLKESDDEQFKKITENVAHYHHEKWNGQGYPEKLHGEEIPFEARIMALADVFDALVSKRCYKESFSFEKAFGIIEESLGSHFDEKLGREFLKCRPILEEYYCLLG